jgi:hypothetical protein
LISGEIEANRLMVSRIEQFLEEEQRRAKKIDALAILLKDPDLTDFVAKLTGETQHAAAPIPSRNGKRHRGKVPDGVTSAIRNIGPELPHPFTVHDVVAGLTAKGFRFKRKALEQVRDSLYFIVREEGSKFRVLEQGKAGKLSKYEYLA